MHLSGATALGHQSCSYYGLLLSCDVGVVKVSVGMRGLFGDVNRSAYEEITTAVKVST